MPVIPRYFGQQGMQAPRSSAGGQAVPQFPQLPTVSPGPFTVGAEAIQRAGAALQGVGKTLSELGRREKEIQEGSQREMATQQFLQQYDADIAAVKTPPVEGAEPPADGTPAAPSRYLPPTQRGDYALSRGKELIESVGATLKPRVRSQFAAEANRYLTARVLREREEGFRGSIQDASRDYQAQLDYHAERAMQAGDPVAGGLHLVNMRRIAGEAVSAGLWTEGQAAQVISQAYVKMAIKQAEVAVEADPMGAVKGIEDRLRNRPTTLVPELDVVPRAALPELAVRAHNALSRESVRDQRAEHDERQALWRSEQAGQARTEFYRTQISPLDPTPENLPKLRQLLELANTTEERAILRPSGHQEVTTLLRGNINIALAAAAAPPPQQRDDPAVEKTLRLQIAVAQTPAQLRMVENTLMTQGAEALTPETFTALNGLITGRRDKFAPSHRPSYREGVEHITRAAIVPGSYGGAGAGILTEETKQKMLNALDQFDREYRTILANDGDSAVNAEAPRLAEAARLAFFPPQTNTLPLVLQQSQTEAELRNNLATLAQQGYGVEVLKAYEQVWKEAEKNFDLPWQVKPPPPPPPTPTTPRGRRP